MSFQSIKFIYLFFPATLGLFLFLNVRYPRLAAAFMIVTSLIFCGYNDLRAVIVLVGSAIFNYLLSFVISKTNLKAFNRQILVIFAILANVSTLFWYKFFSIITLQPLITNDNNTSLLLEIGIPLGLSFYTLYQISFLVDIYKGKVELCDFKSYLLSVSMFAHLPAGPILRYKTSIKQFVNFGKFRVNTENIMLGLSLFTFGLFKKNLLADPLSIFTQQMFKSINSNIEFNFFESLFTVWGFLLQLYFDFSAYSDMAIGLGFCFGLKFPINFNSPLKATSFSDYISRWHISLIEFNREYIFIPASKLVIKLFKNKTPLNYYLAGMIATLFVYISIGFWHSPSLQFLFSGVLIGLIIIISQFFAYLYTRKKNIKINLGYFGEVVNRLIVLTVAAIVGALLMLKDLTSFKLLMTGFTRLNFKEFENVLYNFRSEIGNDRYFSMVKKPIYLIGYESINIPFIFFIFISSYLAMQGPNSMEIFGLKKTDSYIWGRHLFWKPTLFWGVVIGFLLVFHYLFKMDSSIYQNFIYGQF